MEGPFNLAEKTQEHVSLFTLTSKICLIRRDQISRQKVLAYDQSLAINSSTMSLLPGATFRFW